MLKLPRIGLLVLVMLLAMGAGMFLRGGGAGKGGGAGRVQVAQFGIGGGGASVGKALSGPLLVAGDEQYLWLEQPQEIDDKTSSGTSEKHRAFQLLVHPANSKVKGKDLWQLASFDGQRLIEGSPEVMGVVSAASGGAGSAPTTAYVMMDDGILHAYGLPDKDGHKNREEFARLAGNRKPFVMVGGLDGVWVLSHGAQAETPAPTTAAATTRAVETQPATVPATAPATGPAEDTWYVDRFADRRWRPSVLVGKVGAKGMPSAGARVAIAYVSKGGAGKGGGGGKFSMIWFEPGAPRMLEVRTLNVGEAGVAEWGNTVESDVGEDMQLKLSAVTIEPQVFVVWPRTKAGGVEIHGGFLGDDGKMSGHGGSGGMLPAMDLETDNLVEANVAVGRTGNSLAVVGGLKDKEGEMRMWVFDTTGKKIGGPEKVEAAAGWSGESLVTQNLVMIVLEALLGLSLWQWRRKPMPMVVPKDVLLATLVRRGLAALIDVGIPLVIVLVVAGAYRDGQWWVLAGKWAEVWRSPEALASAPELMWVLGSYLAMVTVGELFTGRSLGKAMLGIRVLAIDGTPPTAIAILVRNLVKIPELTSAWGVLLLYVLLNERRQRLGDLLGRTIVVRTGAKPAKAS